jgi:hypothetical protein
MAKAQRGNLEVEAHLKASSRFLYGTDDPRELVESADYFLPLHDWLARGDLLRVVVERAGEMTLAEFAVVASSHRSVRLRRLGDWLELAPEHPAVPDATPEEAA